MRNKFFIKGFLCCGVLLARLLYLGVLILVPAGSGFAQPSPESTQPYTEPTPPPQSTLPPLINMDLRNKIPGQYIVVFNRATVPEDVQAVQSHGGTVEYTYTSALFGFGVKVPDGDVQALLALPGVKYIEADQEGWLNTTQPPTPPDAPGAGIDRIDQRLGMDQKYTYSETGAGVHAYILDTGICAANTEFTGRVGSVTNFVTGPGYSCTPLPPSIPQPCSQHGTHVAGIVAGTTYGVAKGVTLHDVRVVKCNGLNPHLGPVIAGITGPNGVINQVKDPAGAGRPAVANISIEFNNSPSLTTAIKGLIDANVTVVIAAGNCNMNACASTWQGAHDAGAIIVGASDPTNNDSRWSPGSSDSSCPSGTMGSNFGGCLNLFAPGVNILSAWGSGTVPNLLSGTSMAAPHVAGVAARYLQNHTGATPAKVWDAIRKADDKVGESYNWPGIPNPGSTDTPNELLHWGPSDDEVTHQFMWLAIALFIIVVILIVWWYRRTIRRTS